MKNMRKSNLKKGVVRYYHIYPKSEIAENGAVIKLENGKLESLTTRRSGKAVSLEDLNKICGIKIENKEITINSEYNLVNISENRAYKKYEGFKGKGAPKWIINKLIEYCFREISI